MSDKLTIYLLPYTGVGSGITCSLDEGANVSFTNNTSAQEFVITVWREESNQSKAESNQVSNLDTGLRYSDINQTKNHERYITSLVKAGYLQMTNPDNPTASNQKYKKVIKQ